MAHQVQLEVIKDNPIGSGLDNFYSTFQSTCENKGISCTHDAIDQLNHEDLRNLALLLLSSLQSHRVAGALQSRTGRGTLRNDILALISAVASADFDFDRIRPLLKCAVSDELDDALIWDQVCHAVAEATPPPRPVASSLQQTPWLRNTSSFVNSSEHRKYVDGVLKEELGPIYVGVPHFHDTYFGRVPGLKGASEEFFKRCHEGHEGHEPLFDSGWTGWPEDAKQEDVLSWFAEFNKKLATFAECKTSTPMRQRRPLAKPNDAIDGSTGKRKMDIGFMNDPGAGIESRCHWSQVLVPGELKSNQSANKLSEAWLDLGRYAREVLAAQDTRRFVLGFTICKSLMRVWTFDRLGAIVSEQFDINEDGLQFVFTILGFLWMDDEQLGFDPTIVTEKKERFIEINRNGSSERIIIEEVMQRPRCIAGRATTCWKAHREGYPEQPLVIKDSWQYTERDEEGDLLLDATDQGVVNVARYYWHGTVQNYGMDDDVRNNVRGALDITRAANYRPGRSMLPNSIAVGTSRQGRSINSASRKRSSSHIGAPLPPSKRSCSTSPVKSSALPNRVHRRIILRDYGRPIYNASSLAALLAGFGGCIEGHESLYKAGFLHRDISINNLLVNEDRDNPSWPAFLIDLDLSIRQQRKESSGALGKTGTRAFMAIGVLLGEQHSFMHDLESMFWVLFWICIHYKSPDMGRVVDRFDKWNTVEMEELAMSKKGLIVDEGDFIKTAEANFTSYYRPLIQWVNRLRKVVFPNGGRWVREDNGLYTQMREILQKAQEDPNIVGES